ncbi:hypothetical protein, partial [Micromonospora sp. ATA51]|uniref:hypothetical protein n=1 Tax=Micromonospora sp. ATA51 TaxID=2806098 RepID=UPI001A57DCAA
AAPPPYWPPAPFAGHPPHGGYPPAGGAPWLPAAGYDPQDPLVTPPGAGVAGWFQRGAGALRRSWRVLLPIMLITQGLPGIAITLFALPFYPHPTLTVTAPGEPPAPFPADYFRELLVFFGVALVVGVFALAVQCVGWAAGTWAVTRQAAGEPVTVGGALRYGLRRAPALWGWMLLVFAMVLVGTIFCYLPGIYLMCALSLAGPVLLFERVNPIARSFKIFHARLGQVLGRVLLVGLLATISSMVAVPVQMIISLAGGPAGAFEITAGTVVGSVVTVLLYLPAWLAYLIGLVVTYAEQRAHEGPVNSARLAAELG